MIVFQNADDDPEPIERVPSMHPYGSITDGEWCCARCGDYITGCALCIGMPVSMIGCGEYNMGLTRTK